MTEAALIVAVGAFAFGFFVGVGAGSMAGIFAGMVLTYFFSARFGTDAEAVLRSDTGGDWGAVLLLLGGGLVGLLVRSANT